MELGQAEDGFLPQLVQFWEEIVAVGQKLLPQPTMFWHGLNHVPAWCPLGSLDSKFNSIPGRDCSCPSVLGRSVGKAGWCPASHQGWGIGAGNLELWGTAEGLCPMSSAMLCVSYSLSGKTVWLMGTTMYNKRQGVCHTGGPATAGPLRDELMVLLEGLC